jgi:polysaccharide biosynthesis/export protein VpsN
MIRLLCALVLSWFVHAAYAADTDVARDYHLGPGDSINVVVFGEADLSVVASVGDNGRIAYPFLGEIQVVGLTPAEAEGMLVKRLKGDYLVDPKVSVSIAQYRPFFVNGQVRNPGSYPFQPGMTVRKAVSLAGGLSERASERRISLIPETQRDTKKSHAVSMDDNVGPGDIITVEESFF